MTPNEQFLDIGKHVLLVDPQYQGYGLEAHHQAVAGYSNKFLSLSSREGLFITPYAIPSVLLDYYASLDMDIAGKDQIIVSSPTEDSRSLVERISTDEGIMARIAGRRDRVVIPYMMTAQVEEFAAQHELEILSHASDVDEVADKLSFQEALAAMAPEIEAETGFNVAISFAVATIGDKDNLLAAYRSMSAQGTKNVVIVKPRSASAMGVTKISPDGGEGAFLKLVDNRDHFQPSDLVMVEEYVAGDESPSMQAVSDSEGIYHHLYFGKQHISQKDDGSFGYDASHVPFNTENDGISAKDLDTVRRIHEQVGQRLVGSRRIAGIGGIDSVMQLNDAGRVQAIKFTEMNLHFPGSTAVYAAINKLYPNGFSGMAYNLRVPYTSLSGLDEFMQANQDLLIHTKGEYGIFPINGNYPTGVDLVVFAESKEHVDRLLQAIQT